MRVRAYDLAPLLLLLPCTGASRVAGGARAAGDEGRGEELFAPGAVSRPAFAQFGLHRNGLAGPRAAAPSYDAGRRPGLRVMGGLEAPAVVPQLPAPPPKDESLPTEEPPRTSELVGLRKGAARKAFTPAVRRVDAIRPSAQQLSQQRTLRRSRAPQMLSPFGGGGGFLNVGSGELFIVGIVAWAVLGPKELFKLSKQAGAFLGEWQQLARNARDQFQESMDAEMAQDAISTLSSDLNKIKNGFTEGLNQGASDSLNQGASPFADSMPDTIREKAAEISEDASPLQPSEMPDWLSKEEQEELYQKAVAEMGDPEANAKNFAEQISGARNDAVLDEFPQDFSSEDRAADPLQPDEDLLDVQIAEAENRLATLKAEAEVLALRRKREEANKGRAAMLR